MTHQEAVAKAVKLLRLSQSNNPNEAALAAAKAQEIIDRYQLGALNANFEEQAQEPEEEIRDFNDDLIDPGKQVATWKARLIICISKANQCKSYTRRNGDLSGFSVVGRPSDVQTVRYLYAWMKRETDRLVDSLCRGYGTTYINNFRNGVVDTIKLRLEEQRKQTEESVKAEAAAKSSMALVRVNNAIMKREKQLAAVQAWCDKNLKLRSRSVSYTRDDSARKRGQIAGKNISLRPAKASIAA